MVDVYIPDFGAEAEWCGPSIASLSPFTSLSTDGEPNLDETMALACDAGDFFALRAAACERIGACFASAGLTWQPLYGALTESGGRAIPFAVTRRSVAFCDELGLELVAPELGVVRQVNSKIWSAVAREKAGVPLGEIAYSSAEAVARAAPLLERGPIILKAAFGVSGAGNVVVASQARLEAVARVLRAEEARGRDVELVIEPLLPKRADFSSHLMLGKDGRCELLGFQDLINIGSRYLGSRRPSNETLELLGAGSLTNTLDAMAEQLAEAGYYGPVCVDGLILSDASVTPVVEVNARMSMGLLNQLLIRKISVWGLTSTLLKFRVVGRANAPSVIDLLSRAGLLPLCPGDPAVLPVTSNAALAGKKAREIVVALLYSNTREESLLYDAMQDALAAGGLDTNMSAEGLNVCNTLSY